MAPGVKIILKSGPASILDEMVKPFPVGSSPRRLVRGLKRRMVITGKNPQVKAEHNPDNGQGNNDYQAESFHSFYPEWNKMGTFAGKRPENPELARGAI